MSATAPSPRRRRWPWIVGFILIVAAISWWWLGLARSRDANAARRPAGPVVVVTAMAEARDVPVKLLANGTVTALQSVDLRAQITSTVREVHIREGQNVKAGELLFSLDAGTEQANLKKALAQVEKDRADLATAQRNLQRQRDLFEQKFIAQAALDTAQNQVDTLNGQLGIDLAAVEGAKVARAYTEIRAPFSGRTGLINVRAGSLVQPGQNNAASGSGAATTGSLPLVTVTQVDPISVAFTLPEKELPALQQALRQGPVEAVATPQSGGESFKGRIVFVDNAVDTTTGTIRLKAEFDNPQARLWPGMYVTVLVSPRTLQKATVVPAQAVQTGPENRFVYVVDGEHKVAPRTVKLGYVEQGFAVVDGISPGMRVVTEGAQNLRPGSVVAEAERASPVESAEGNKPEGKGGKQKAAANPA
ncbi:MAG TPA: efflux RND transporter periplasmic adaptor subunit [Usitatibacter sp.]|nr:efflux RND transporter periplasmic adaptor subunit [Usitatibacter sp.]